MVRDSANLPVVSITVAGIRREVSVVVQHTQQCLVA